MPLVLVAPPAVEPITLADLKLQLGLAPYEDTDHVKTDMLNRQLRRYIATARAECENRTRRAFITQTWKMLCDGWEEPAILLPKPPYQSIVSFTYVDIAGATQSLPLVTDYGVSPADPFYSYQLDAGSVTQPGRLSPGYARPWPPVLRVPNNVQIVFTCGYGDTGDAVPEPITQAVLFLAHSYFDPTFFKNVDSQVDSLLNVYVNRIS